MPVVAVFEAPSLTQGKYEESVAKLSGGKSRLESPADWPVEGLLAHVAGQGATGFRVVDVWDCQKAFQRFGEALQELGIEDDEPDVYPAYTFVSA